MDSTGPKISSRAIAEEGLMQPESTAGSRPVPRDHVEDARRQPGLSGQTAERERRQRRELGRLEHHSAPGRQSRSHLPRSQRERKVPRHNSSDRTDRLTGHQSKRVRRGPG
jgi:hypothetical protein